MPAKPPSANRYRNRLMRNAAKDGMLVTLRCGRCGQRVNYWADDLVQVVGWDHELHVPPFPCSRCGTSEFVSMRAAIPSAEAMQGLTVRRPVRQVVRWIWRDETARGMCKLFGNSTAQEAMRRLFDGLTDRAGNLAPGSVYPDQTAAIIRHGEDRLELVKARWGMPSPPGVLKTARDPGVTNLRTLGSPTGGVGSARRTAAWCR